MSRLWYIPFGALLTTMATGCAPDIYMVSVVEKSHQQRPVWITRQVEHQVIGIGEHRYEREAYNQALGDLQVKIASEIGIEVTFQSQQLREESRQGMTETATSELGVIGDAILREIHLNISETYWEHCRAQTGKKSFEDFYRYYIRATITPEMITKFRELTKTENDRRLGIYRHWFTRAESLEVQGADYALEALRGYIQTLNSSNSLLYERDLHTRASLAAITGILHRLRIKLLENYSEVRPVRHYIDFQVLYDGKPMAGVPVAFEQLRGNCDITHSALSNGEGVVRCEIGDCAMHPYNELNASVDLRGIFSQMEQVKVRAALQPSLDVKRLAESIVARAVFSTQAKIAVVRGSSLELSEVKFRYSGLYRHIKSLRCFFHLEELNGRSVEFHSFDVAVQCWYEPFASFTVKTDERFGNYALVRPLKLDYHSRTRLELPNTQPIVRLMNDLKSAHEIGMRQIQISLKLYGMDDGGNMQQVLLETDGIPWNNFLKQ